jgi:hypothetical protein
MIVGAISAFNEEGRIGEAVKSLLEGGCGRVLVLDGAWLDDAGVPFGGESYWSTDATVEEARAAGAEVQAWSGGTDAAKQTQLVRRAGILGGEFVVKIDADERLVNVLPEITRHSMIWLHNHGENDIPDVAARRRLRQADPAVPRLQALHRSCLCQTWTLGHGRRAARAVHHRPTQASDRQPRHQVQPSSRRLLPAAARQRARHRALRRRRVPDPQLCPHRPLSPRCARE